MEFLLKFRFAIWLVGNLIGELGREFRGDGVYEKRLIGPGRENIAAKYHRTLGAPAGLSVVSIFYD